MLNYPPANALKFMHEEVTGLDQELLAKFVLCLGTYPVGSLVTLASKHLAIVMRLTKSDPLNPVVMIFYELNSKNFEQIRQLDLAKPDDSIVASLDPKDFNFEASDFLRETLLAH